MADGIILAHFVTWAREERSFKMEVQDTIEYFLAEQNSKIEISEALEDKDVEYISNFLDGFKLAAKIAVRLYDVAYGNKK